VLGAESVLTGPNDDLSENLLYLFITLESEEFIAQSSRMMQSCVTIRIA